ncbi:hypothetical protein EB796_008874 [Bugula neritina]|uniref:Uncharacterized protein n=1 Tax=Bugula neritina TaxID=10212 RepID=A0A7J7K2G9_BUGNE|nr:hypothetical protein EB796_008874 [Bugula neritina]
MLCNHFKIYANTPREAFQQLVLSFYSPVLFRPLCIPILSLPLELSFPLPLPCLIYVKVFHIFIKICISNVKESLRHKFDTATMAISPLILGWKFENVNRRISGV